MDCRAIHKIRTNICGEYTLRTLPCIARLRGKPGQVTPIGHIIANIHVSRITFHVSPMSAIVKTKRRGNPAISTAALWLGLGLAVTFFLVRYGQQLLLTHALNEKADVQRTVNS